MSCTFSGWLLKAGCRKPWSGSTPRVTLDLGGFIRGTQRRVDCCSCQIKAGWILQKKTTQICTTSISQRSWSDKAKCLKPRDIRQCVECPERVQAQHSHRKHTVQGELRKEQKQRNALDEGVEMKSEWYVNEIEIKVNTEKHDRGSTPWS